MHVDDGGVAIDDNAAEYALRAVALGRQLTTQQYLHLLSQGFSHTAMPPPTPTYRLRIVGQCISTPQFPVRFTFFVPHRSR